MSGIQPFAWDEDTQSRIGPGISRPLEKEWTRAFTLTVRTGHSMPMKVTLKAATAAKATQYALARWPGARVEVLK
jgi:hypothetical protein